MMADKYKIIHDATSGVFDQHELDITGLSNGVDDYMKATCLELLDYMAKNSIECIDSIKGYIFYYRGQYLTKEQLFENFL
jgi:hypothetical protein